MLSAQKYGKNLHVNYSPFGAILYGRNWSSEKYRYGFNGMEKDDEVAGAGNSYTAEYWQYDSRLGRRWNIDPVYKFFESPYSVYANNPLSNVDPNGNDWYKNNSTGRYEWHNSSDKEILKVENNKVVSYSWISNKINEKILEDIGALFEMRLLPTFTPGYTSYMRPEKFAPLGKMYLTGINRMFHPNPKENSDRKTYGSTIFKANEKITAANAVKIFMGGFVSGAGPENWYFDENHEVSKSLNGIGILSNAVDRFKEINKGLKNISEFQTYANHHDQTFSSVSQNVLDQISKGSYSGTIEDFIGGAHITIVPLGILEDGYVEIFVEIFNVTSVGSGSIGNSQSFPRPQDTNYAQPYTNVSQTFQLRLKVKVDEK